MQKVASCIGYHIIVNYGPVIYFLCRKFLNQARASLWPACAWFLSIASVHELLYVCVSAPKAINN